MPQHPRFCNVLPRFLGPVAPKRSNFDSHGLATPCPHYCSLFGSTFVDWSPVSPGGVRHLLSSSPYLACLTEHLLYLASSPATCWSTNFMPIPLGLGFSLKSSVPASGAVCSPSRSALSHSLASIFKFPRRGLLRGKWEFCRSPEAEPSRVPSGIIGTCYVACRWRANCRESVDPNLFSTTS